MILACNRKSPTVKDYEDKRPRDRYVAEPKRLLGMQDFGHVTRALAAFVTRPAVVRGLEIPKRS